MIVVVKVGSSSVTVETVQRLGGEIASARAEGHTVVVVTSGAIAAGWSALDRGAQRPSDPAVLQAVSAVGQHRLMRLWQDAFDPYDLLAGQVLLAPLDFVHRTQYLHARGTLRHLVDLGVVPVVNENDAVADEEIRFGDNDRLAALVAHLVGAHLLVLLTDAPGLLTADPRHDAEASLIEEVVEIDHQLEQLAGGPGSAVGSGGMASKLAAAKIATWSGVETVIGDAARPGVLASALAASPGRARSSGPARAACRPASSGSPSPSGPRAGWRSTRGRWRRWSSGADRSSPPGSSGWPAPSRHRRGGDRRSRRHGLRQGPGPGGRPVGGRLDGAAQPGRRPSGRPCFSSLN